MKLNTKQFENDLKDGLVAEELLYQKLKDHVPIKKFNTHDIDGIIYHDNEIKTYDCKIRDFKYYQEKDLLVEIIKNDNSNEEGWLYYSRADLIFYGWFNKRKTNFIECYSFPLNDMRECVKTMLKYRDGTIKKVSSNNGSYNTISLLIPLEEIRFLLTPLDSYLNNFLIHYKID